MVEVRDKDAAGARSLRDAQFNPSFLLQHFAAIAALRPNARPRSAHETRLRAARLMGHVDAHLAALEGRRGSALSTSGHVIGFTFARRPRRAGLAVTTAT